MWIFVDVSRSIFFSGGEDATLLAVQKLGQLSDEEEILWGLLSCSVHFSFMASALRGKSLVVIQYYPVTQNKFQVFQVSQTAAVATVIITVFHFTFHIKININNTPNTSNIFPVI